MRKVIILFPRLDVTFKEGPVPEGRGEIPPIRIHWLNLANRLLQYHRSKGDDVQSIEKPLWQFTPEFVESLGADIDIVYIPHKSTDTFPVSGKEVRYYMQSVFPFQFYIDSKGFAGGASRYPFDFDADREIPHGSFYAQMQARAFSGESKFAQPPMGKITVESDGPYVLFPCQIPHDETIKYHSDISVLDALMATCEATKKLNMPLVVKGHPVNPGSMAPLYQAVKQYDHVHWVDDVSIHDLIPKAHAVVVVNSGTGMEAMLHKRPVITFGRCEYDCVSNKATADNIVDVLRSPVFNEKEVRAFFESWYEWTYDTRNGNSFNGL